MGRQVRLCGLIHPGDRLIVLCILPSPPRPLPSSVPSPHSEPQSREPSPSSVGPFAPWDFEALSPARSRSPEYNEHRLQARRRLLGLGKAALKETKAMGVPLEARSSLHNPHAFNGNRVSRLWTYLVRPKAEKARLRKVLGADLAKDLNQAYKNVYLCLAMEHDALEVSLRIHKDAWYDGQNLVRRVKAEGLDGWLSVLNTLDGYRLGLDDWKGEWRCGELTRERLEEYLGYYTPGEHQLVVERRWPVPTNPEQREALLQGDIPQTLLEEVLRLVPLYKFCAWSASSDFLFSS